MHFGIMFRPAVARGRPRSLRLAPVVLKRGKLLRQPVSVGDMHGLQLREYRQHPPCLGGIVTVTLKPADDRDLRRDVMLARANTRLGLVELLLEERVVDSVGIGGSPIDTSQLAGGFALRMFRSHGNALGPIRAAFLVSKPRFALLNRSG
jgi:hypothetical protein